MSEIVGISVKFTGDDSDLKAKVNSSKQSLKDFEEQLKKLKVDRLGLQSLDIKAKLSLNTEDYKAKHAEIQRQMLELKDKKINLQIDTENAKSKMTEFQQFSNSMLGKITFGNLLASGVTMGMNVATQAVKAFTQALADSLKVASQYEIALKGLNSVAQAFGQDSDKATAYARELARDGLIPLSSATATLKNLISTGYSLDEAYTLANALKNIGAFNNVVGDLGLAMETSSRGFRINSIELIDNIGLTERLSSMLKKAGVDISQGIALTESSTQRQALYNSVLKEYGKFAGDAAEYAETYAGKQAQANTAIKEAQNSFGQFLDGPGKAFQDWVKLEAESLKTVLDYLKEISVERDKAFTPAGYVEGKGGVSKLSTDELKEMQINAQEKIKNYLAEQAKASMIPGVGSLFVGLNAIELEKTKKILLEINAEIAKRNQLESLGIKDKSRQDRVAQYKAEQEAKGKALQSDKTSKDADDFAKALAASIEKHVTEALNTSYEKSKDPYAQYKRQAAFTPEEMAVTGFEYNKAYSPALGGTGRDEGARFGRMAFYLQKEQQESDAKKLRLAREANRTYEAEYRDFYINLSKIEKESMDERTKQMKDAQESIASSLTEIGNMLNNDFIKALGNVASNIIDIQDSLEQAKTGGTIGAIAGGLGVVGAVISIGQTIYNLLNPAAETQMSAAEKMEQAVSEFKSSVADKTVVEKYAQFDVLRQRQQELPGLIKAKEASLIEATAKNDFERMGRDVKSLEALVDEWNAIPAKIKELMPIIKESLSIDWSSLKDGIKSAFDEVDLSSFSENFEKSMKKSLRNALIQSFLESNMMKSLFSGISDEMYKLLESVNFDATKLSGKDMDVSTRYSLSNISQAISKAGVAGEAFYTLLEKLGLGVSDVTNKMTETASALSNVPSGIKLAYKRFEATTATQSTTPMINVYVGNEQLTSVVTRQQATANNALYGSNSNSGVY